MLQFLQNPWIVGIGGGIISGIIVFFVSNWIMDKKSNSEYVGQIQAANTEVVNMLKPYIVDNGLPEKDVLDAIVASVSRKYKVKNDDLYSIKIFCEELIREIIGNVYVSNDKKAEYSKQLSDYINNIDTSNNINESLNKSTEISERSDYKQRLSKQYSILLSITTTMMTFSVLVITIMQDRLDFLAYPFKKNIIFLLFVTIITVAGIMPLMTTLLLRYITKFKTKKKI